MVGMAILLGGILGTILALVRLYRIPVFSQLAVLYISFIRGTPSIVQMFIVFYGFPYLVKMVSGLDINRLEPIYFVILSLGFNAAAFLSEIIRASILAVPSGQTEAAYSIGLTKLQNFRRIIGPQALFIALPSLGTTAVGLLQDTSIAYLLGIVDVMGKVSTIGARTYHYLEGYVVAAVLFVTLSFLLEKGTSILEKRNPYSNLNISR